LENTNQREKLKEEIASLIIESLGLDHVKPHELEETTPLVGEGLDLDSIDILELVVHIEEKYGIRVEKSEEGIKVFKNIGSLVDFIEKNASPR
jgi:acyl carrier protein